MSTQQPTPPEPLQTGTIEAELIKRRIWKRLWLKNEHFMGVIVGREGKGKSYTGMKISSVVDPTFTAERIMFDPGSFLQRLQEWKEQGETQGKMIVVDEAGVGLGIKTWYDEDQILFNKILQIVRDENMGILFTVPRLEDMDSQSEGRLHAYMEVTAKKEGEYVLVKWHDWDPTRDGRGNIYRENPVLNIGGQRQPIKRLKLSPVSDGELVENYERRKNEFQAEQYANAIEQLEGDVDDGLSVRDVAMEIADASMEKYVSVHSQNGSPYINEDLIRADYGLSHSDCSAVKSLLQRQFDTEDLRTYA